jgi:hypothetical protein
VDIFGAKESYTSNLNVDRTSKKGNHSDIKCRHEGRSVERSDQYADICGLIGQVLRLVAERADSRLGSTGSERTWPQLMCCALITPSVLICRN